MLGYEVQKYAGVRGTKIRWGTRYEDKMGYEVRR